MSQPLQDMQRDSLMTETLIDAPARVPVLPFLALCFANAAEAVEVLSSQVAVVEAVPPSCIDSPWRQSQLQKHLRDAETTILCIPQSKVERPHVRQSMCCWYHNQKRGCKRGQACPFEHDESAKGQWSWVSDSPPSKRGGKDARRS